MTKKWRCKYCDQVTVDGELLSAANPFDPSDRIAGCPNCKGVDQFAELCDEPSCTESAGCGFPTQAGYRHTCHNHWIGR